ncbi:hypothetical protein [Umezawaea sp. Da 62-37]|uniref:hypothetical protein n=1 Tax=Umezawaea sp. Da 62-37 TaxID=3075927 RepID=UPI0028F7191B|nr:hypothetical protein [Umezawaea sp. Da 62-37]WNV86103.1 hypothetical protein RM788_49670 [Umezawaea sp. Da 62-37]
MRIARTAIAVGLAMGALLGAAAQAQAQPEGGVTAKSWFYRVTTWHDASVRSCAATTCALDQEFPLMAAGRTNTASCWLHGEAVTDLGYTNDIWVKLERGDNVGKYVNAVYLVGDEYGNIPADSVCAP